MNLIELTTTGAALGAATFGGVLFAFSTFVMPGLDHAPPSAAVATMQEINRAAPRSLLALDMVATLLLCMGVVVLAVLELRTQGTASVLLLVGAGLYVVSFVITAAYHIPHNDAFASVVAQGARTAQEWAAYARPWELWNHVRAAAALAGAASMIAGLLLRSA